METFSGKLGMLDQWWGRLSSQECWYLPWLLLTIKLGAIFQCKERRTSSSIATSDFRIIPLHLTAMTKATSYLSLVLVALALVSPSLCYPRQFPGKSMPGESMPGQGLQGQAMQGELLANAAHIFSCWFSHKIIGNNCIIRTIRRKKKLHNPFLSKV